MKRTLLTSVRGIGAPIVSVRGSARISHIKSASSTIPSLW
jgi:hypothetical protein